MGTMILSSWVIVRVIYDLRVWGAVQLLPFDEVLFTAGSGTCRNPSLKVLIVKVVGSSFTLG